MRRDNIRGYLEINNITGHYLYNLIQISITCSPLLICRGVWEIWWNSIKGNVWVILCHEYIILW